MRTAKALATILVMTTAVPAGAAPSEPCDGGNLPSGIYTDAVAPVVQTRDDGIPVPRTFHFSVPDAPGPIPLVVDLHGGGQPSWQQELISEFMEIGLDEGFVVLQPDSLGRSWATTPGAEAANGGISDVEFLARALDAVSSRVCVGRMFATGFSSGAIMAGRVACAGTTGELGMRPVAGIAPVAYGPLPADGRPPFDELGGSVCATLSDAPVPMRMVVSNNDRTVAGAFAVPRARMLEGFVAMARAWATDNGCEPDTIVATTGQTGWGVLADVHTFDCNAAATTVLDVFDTGGPRDGHAWPGRFYGGAYATSRAIWSFFADGPVG